MLTVANASVIYSNLSITLTIIFFVGGRTVFVIIFEVYIGPTIIYCPV
jgi:hypothetical protein